MIPLILTIATILGAVGLAAFMRPQGAFRRVAMILLAALAFPFLVGFVVAPFLGDGAGMGVAFILLACSAVLMLAALAAALGAGARRVWTSLQE